MNNLNNVRIGGTLLINKPGTIFDRQVLQDEMGKLGLGDLVPPPCSPKVALHLALKECYKDKRILPKEGAAYELLTIFEQPFGQPNLITHHSEWCVTDAGGIAQAGEQDSVKLAAVNDAFLRYLGSIFKSSVSVMLTRIIMQRIPNSLCILEQGGLYWIADTHEAMYKSVEAGLQLATTAGKSCVHFLHHQMDADALRCLRDRVIESCLAEVDRIEKLIENPDAGKLACENRAKEALELGKMVASFEELLQFSIPEVHEAVKAVHTGAAKAAILKSVVSAA